MTPDQFCYWLQGFVEMADPAEITPEQVKMIKDHLALVFEKVTPDRKKEETITPPEVLTDIVDRLGKIQRYPDTFCSTVKLC